ncbi:protein SMALL AUXIN UP-REGULATED RNA 16-like [Solanum dulcamara]|uniref:protein SMALL AUXIN UP-REGULATED RNA 16-like n=1 Tax=Solanum dulcamara TaxID=45834 RepID=UPI00248697DB|nr:protein SMALL AUXIN UP-REGULATED RNA 16-like [Solanum dulcamara]
MGKEISNACMVMLKLIMEKFNIDLLQLIPNFDIEEYVETPRENNEVVPNDVKEGHFVVFSVNPEEEPKRFIVELHCLTNPSFLKLLKQAEDEYGFHQKGVLELPCRAAELQKILKLKIG